MPDCAWVAAGYPVLLTGIAILWKVYQKSQKDLLSEKEHKARILESLLEMITSKEG